MKSFLVSLVIFFVSSQAKAMDHRSQFGVGGALGLAIPAPWAHEIFRNAVSTKAPTGSLWARYIVGTPEVGTELSYNYFGVGKQNINSNSLVLSFISRQNPWGNFHPLYGIGVGYSKNDNWFTTGDWETPIYKLTAGVEFELNEHTDVGLRIDHMTIFKSVAAERDLHVLIPMLTINHYFGAPAPIPAPPAPTPVAAPAPLPAPAPAPAVQPEPTPDTPALLDEAPKPVKKATKPAPARKKPAPKGKKKTR